MLTIQPHRFLFGPSIRGFRSRPAFGPESLQEFITAGSALHATHPAAAFFFGPTGPHRAPPIQLRFETAIITAGPPWAVRSLPRATHPAAFFSYSCRTLWAHPVAAFFYSSKLRAHPVAAFFFSSAGPPRAHRYVLCAAHPFSFLLRRGPRRLLFGEKRVLRQTASTNRAAQLRPA